MGIKSWPGGVIRKTPVSPSGPYQSSTASGIWSLEQVAYWKKQSLWPTTGNVDPSFFIENIFSSYLYTGTGATQTITNGIDLSGKGGLVWTKSRGGSRNHNFVDTARGGGFNIASNDTGAQYSLAVGVTSFNANGYQITGSFGDVNEATFNPYVSWTFRKQAKFFDVVTYTGDGTAGRTVSHNLGSVPGCIIVKRTDTIADWEVYHRGLDATQPEKYQIYLNATNARQVSTARWNDTAPTATQFTLGTWAGVNANGGTYVAYLFAHDAGGFGLTGTDNVISCGSFTTDAGGYSSFINLGYEPQWILFKMTNSATSSNWNIIDNMRDLTAYTNQAGLGANLTLFPNLSNAEAQSASGEITSTGFYAGGSASSSFIYIAIRRGPMQTPTSGTSVFSPITLAVNGSTNQTLVNTGWPVDWQVGPVLADGSDNKFVHTRLIGNTKRLYTNLTNAEENSSVDFGWSTGMKQSQTNEAATWYLWRRAPGFFDVVCYTGTGANRTVTHNLAAVPELMIVKVRSAVNSWLVYAAPLGATKRLFLSDTSAEATSSAFWNNTAPTSSVFTVGTADGTNLNAATFVAYLFATLPGVSKVGSYTGTGTTLSVDCGFTAGARFVMIKRTDSTGDWYVWDTARGIIAGNDPYILLNSIAAAVTNTDYIDPYSPGFELSSTAPAALNANGGTYIFLAIA